MLVQLLVVGMNDDAGPDDGDGGIVISSLLLLCFLAAQSFLQLVVR